MCNKTNIFQISLGQVNVLNACSTGNAIYEKSYQQVYLAISLEKIISHIVGPAHSPDTF